MLKTLENLQLFAHKKGGGSMTIHSSLKLKVLYVSNVKVATKNKYLYTQLLNNSAKVCTFV